MRVRAPARRGAYHRRMAHEPVAELWPTTLADGSTVWYFHRQASNGRITDGSEAYTTRRSARRGILRRWPGIKIVAFASRPR